MLNKSLSVKSILNKEKRKKLQLPIYSTFEEVLSAISHGIGAILAIAAIVLLIVFSDHKAKTITCVTIYSATLFLLYIVSTLYHALDVNKAKAVFRVLDHCSIFILIFGTYTPICLLILGNVIGWVLFSIVLASAIIGVVFNAINLNKYSKLSLACYIAMGWSIVIAIRPLVMSVSSKQITFLFLGGICFTIGAIIYCIGKKIKYMHSIWHIFVLSGSIFHFFMIFDFVKSM